MSGFLDGKVAVITGAGTGMGKASAGVVAREGTKVLGADVSGAEEATAAEVGAHLASDRAPLVTGAIIPVDGGWSVRLA